MSNESKRDRSPNYPKMPLEDSVETVAQLHKKAGKAVIRAEVAVGAIGYSGLNGAALTTLGALSQYGLVDRPKGEGIVVSPLALKILHPVNDPQLISSKRESALRPRVFNELFTGGFHHSDPELIRNHLIQQGFTPDGAQKAANVFKANVEFANLLDESIKLEVYSDRNTAPKVSTEPFGQFVYPKPADQLPDTTTSPMELRQSVRAGEDLSLPLESGKVVRVPKMTEDDYELFLETLKLWRRRIVLPQGLQALTGNIATQPALTEGRIKFLLALPTGQVVSCLSGAGTDFSVSDFVNGQKVTLIGEHKSDLILGVTPFFVFSQFDKE